MAANPSTQSSRAQGTTSTNSNVVTMSSTGSVTTKTTGSSNFLNDVSLALKATETLQDSVFGILQEFTDWSTDAPEKGVANVKQTIKNIQTVQNKLEKIVAENSRVPEAQPVALGNTGLVGLDPGEDKSTFYKQLLDAGCWARSVSREASEVSKELKRKNAEFLNDINAKTKKDDTYTEHKTFYQHLDIIKKDTPDLIIEYDTRSLYFCKMKIKDIFSSVLVLSGNSPHRIVIRGYGEDITDLWTQSQYVVFKKVTDVAQAALLHFFQSSDNIDSLKAFLKWLSSYKSLFSAKCAECGKHLQMAGTEKLTFLPPCWRDFTTFRPLHLGCR